jgi:hypothetical protein
LSQRSEDVGLITAETFRVRMEVGPDSIQCCKYKVFV